MGTKALYLDGKKIADYESTGDDTRDMELARDLLREKGLYQEITTIQAMYRQARSFATVTSYIYERDLKKIPRNGLSIAPFVVNSAFSIEVYLKTLGEIHGQSVRGHKLIDLYDNLPAAAQRCKDPCACLCAEPRSSGKYGFSRMFGRAEQRVC